MRRFVNSAVLAVFFCAAPATRASAADIWQAWRSPSFSTLKDRSALPHPTTTAIIQDTSGFIWIGTRRGLARYDGQRVLTFLQKPGDPSGLTDNYVRNLLALPGGRVLVGTNVGGLLRFDPKTNRFARLQLQEEEIGERIFGLAADHRGGAWIASDRGVGHLLPDSDKIEGIWRGNGKTVRAFAVHQDRDGTVWIGSGSGLLVRRPGESTVRQFRAHGAGASILNSDAIWALMRDRAGRLWVGTGSHGIICLTGNEARIADGLSADSPLVHHRTIRAIAQDRKGRIFIATDGIGMIMIDGDRPPTALRHDAERENSLPGDTVRDIFVDRDGGVWAATDVGPAYLYAKQKPAFTITSGMSERRKSLASNDVRGLGVDRQGRIWAGLDNGRIDILDGKAGLVRHIALTGEYAGQDVKSLAIAPDGTVYAGARGLVAIDSKTLGWHGIDVPGVNGAAVISLLLFGHRLMIGTYEGLFIRDLQTGRITRYVQKGDETGGLPGNEVINITAIGDSVWLSTSRGISRFDPQSGTFENYRNRPGHPKSLPQDYTSSIIKAHGRLWVGTYGGVAYARLGKGPLRFGAVTERDGLAGNDVSSLVADASGKIWVASSGGLSVIDPARGTARSASTVDGLPQTTFNRRTAEPMADGTLLFGGTGGLTVVQPEAMQHEHTNAAALVPTTLEIDGHVLPFGTLAGDEAVNIGSDVRSLRLGFALLDFAAPQDIRYSYRLDGFDAKWVSVPSDTPAIAAYTNLPGGDYTLRLRARVPGLEGQTVEHVLSLHVAPAWYQTWTVRLAFIIAAIFAIVGLIQIRTAFMRHRTRMLERIVEERTQALVEANAELDRQARTDALTGLLNRRSMMDRLSEEHARATRSGPPFSLALVDIDRFKAINDRYGHHVGDMVLREVAARLTGAVRSVDIVARLGGEEFVVLLPECGREDAVLHAERLRDVIADPQVDVDGACVPVTVSIGVADWVALESPSATLQRADKAMYQAKQSGRNAVFAAPPDDYQPDADRTARKRT
ncbi:MAG: hypothetical protein CMN72_08395 [Sphingomonas sp.]|nr:hypothetical protein [Sphingomonas sp.]